LSPEEGTKWAKIFLEHSSISFANELKYAGYNDVPTSWLFCEDDKTIKPEVQQIAIDRIEQSSGRKVDVTRKFYDHVPIVTNVEGAVDWIVSVVEKGGE
jgi:hypothetical protein